MTASHGHVVRDHLPFTNEPMMFDRDIWTQVGGECRQDLSPALSTLGTRTVVHHVLGDQLIDGSLVACRTTAEQGFDDRLRVTLHTGIVSDQSVLHKAPAPSRVPRIAGWGTSMGRLACHLRAGAAAGYKRKVIGRAGPWQTDTS